MQGRALSHYEILEQVGRGGMGVVYKARDTVLGRLVAIKQLPAELADDPTRVELLRREAQAIAALDHPRIVTIYSVEQLAGSLCLVMEYVQGESLARAIPANGFPLGQFLDIAIPLADALGTAHERGIIHRDLKPGNIMLSPDGRPKILDFGLARLRPVPSGEPESQLITQGVSLAGPQAGTLPYMSPEQLCNELVDHRSDLFSLGIVLYEMATGRYPFRRDEGSVVTSLLRDSPPPVETVRPDLPPQLGRILDHCLEKEPGKRTQSAADLRHQLQDLRSETATGRRLATHPRRARQRFLAPLAAVVLAAAGWFAYERLREPVPVAPPPYVEVVESRIFPGDRGPEHIRQGFVADLARSVREFKGVYPPGREVKALSAFLGPLPDFTVEADALLAEGRVQLGFRLLGRHGETASEVFDGSSDDPYEVLERAGQAIARSLSAASGLEVRARAPRPLTTDRVALELYQRAAVSPGHNEPDRTARLAWLAEALERDPRFAVAHVLQGELLLASPTNDNAADSRAADAEAACAAAARLEPGLATAHACLGSARQRLGRSSEAAEAFAQALMLDVADVESHVALRSCNLALGLPQSAGATWLAIVDRHPEHWAGYYSLGAWYQDHQRYDLAAEQYSRAIERSPRNPQLHSFLATANILAGRNEDAIDSLKQSIEIQPSFPAYYNLGGLYYNQRLFEASVRAFERALELRPLDYRVHGRLGWASHWLPEKRTESQRHLRRAIALAAEHLEQAPDDSGAVILTAIYHALLGDRVEALAHLERATELRPNYAHNDFLAAVVLNHLGETVAALDAVERAVAGGYSKAEIRTIVDLENLYAEPRFQQAIGIPGETAAATAGQTLERRRT